MNVVAKGQTWSVLDHFRQRVEWTIDDIRREGIELRAFGHLVSNGKLQSYTVKTIAKGQRGARLVRNADGSEATKLTKRAASAAALFSRDDDTEDKTASDFRRTVEPHGRASVTPRMEQAFKMKEAGKSSVWIAQHFDVSPSRVRCWFKAVRERQEDEQHLQGTGT